MQAVLDQLVTRLNKAHGEQLVSVVLYGSAAAGEHDKNFSDINILCVLRQITPVELRAAESVFKWWRAEGNPPPLLLSEHEVETSTDCFAIEFHDIKRNHRILAGKDVVSALEVDNSFYRAQVERELRAKLLRLRTKASGILSDRELLARLLADSVSTFCVLFRHALLLHGVEAELKKRAIVEQASATFGIDAAPFLQLLDAREEKIPLKKLDPEPLFAAYLKECSIVIDAVDRLNK
jgi:predicted nucleotidyltransferase